jgi:Ankyrin repeats (3 copies)
MSIARDHAAGSIVLSDTAMIQQVLSFLPPGNWLVLGAVCREWQAVYADRADQQVCSFSIYYDSKLVACCSKTALYSAAVGSPAMARLAHSCGLALRKNDKLQAIAGRYADLDTLAALHELGMPLDCIVIRAVAVSGRLNILQHLITEWNCEICTSLSYYAARSGSISMLDWLKAQEKWYEIDEWNACSGAAGAGHLAVLQHLIKEGCDWDEQSIVHSAAGSGSIQLVEWLRLEHDVETDDETITAAASFGQIDMCKHLLSIGCEMEYCACSVAAENGHIDTLHWLLENDCSYCMSEVCMGAARHGYVDILDYIVEQGELFDTEQLTEALNCAGMHNQLTAAQWLRQHGAEWPGLLGCNERYCVRQWSSDMVVWARAEGCTAPAVAVTNSNTNHDSGYDNDDLYDDADW